MNDTCKTVAVQTANGPVDMNEADYTPDMGPLVGSDTAPPAPADTAPPAPADTAPPAPADTAPPAPADTVPPAPMLVSKQGRKFFVVDGQAKPIDVAGIDVSGYAAEADAWAAIMALTK